MTSLSPAQKMLKIDFTANADKLFNQSFYEIRRAKSRFLVVFGGAGCFHPAQRVVTTRGCVPISSIKVGDRVKSYNEDTGKAEYKLVEKVFEYPNSAPLYKISYNGREIIATKSHEFYYGGAWLSLDKIVTLWHETVENNTRIQPVHGINRRRNKNAKLEGARRRKGNETGQRQKRVFTNYAKGRQWGNKDDKGSPDNLHDISRHTGNYANSQSQERNKDGQQGGKSGMDDALRKHYARQRNRAASRFKGVADWDVFTKRASGKRNKGEVQASSLYKTNARGRIWSYRVRHKGRINPQELGLAGIKNINEIEGINRVFDLCIKDNHNYYLDCGQHVLVHNSGKSVSVHQSELVRLLTAQHNTLVLRKHGSDLYDSCFALFKQQAARFGIMHLFDWNFSNYKREIVNKLTGKKIILRGVDDPEKVKSIVGIRRIVMEEANQFDFTDFRELNRRARGIDGIQITLILNPIDETHWIKKNLVDESGPYHSDTTVLKYLYRDNKFLTAQDIEELERLKLIDPVEYDIYVLGKWGIRDNKHAWLYNFEEKKHAPAEVPFLPTFPVYLSFDFNNDPFTCVAAQFSPVMGTRNSFLHIIKEFSGSFKIEEMCRRIRTTFPASILFVTGDRSGQNEDIGRNQTLYQMIAAQLGLSKKQLNLNSSNLEHADSRLLCNSIVGAYPNFLISARDCPNLVAQCRNAKVDDKAKRPSVLLKDREDHKNDEFDGFRYLLQTYFLDFAKRTYYKVLK